MSKETLEHLSSLMDGETTPETGMFLARRVCADRELSETWERYHLIRDCMRSSGKAWSVSSVNMQISEMLPAEDNNASVPVQANRWMKPVAGMAIAATVAMTAILVVSPEGDLASPEAAVQPFASPNTLNVVPPSQAASFGTESLAPDNRMNDYLQRHNRVTGSVGRQGFVTAAPIVATNQATDSNETDSGDSDGSTDAGQETP